MDQESADSWKEETLNEIFLAMAAHAPLREMLVFKGALVLNAHLNEKGRRSLDIDSNILKRFAEANPDKEVQQATLKKEIANAITNRFEGDSPVRLTLEEVAIKQRPKHAHPLGWDAYDVKIKVIDHSREGVRGLPKLSIDIAAPESLTADSVAPLQVNNETLMAYTLERTAGEKLRAFLSTLPEYRQKVRKPGGEAIRVKDIFDIARIARAHPIMDDDFWEKVGNEFRLACESRFISCAGISTFEQSLPATRSSYESDSTLPNKIAFDEAWQNIHQLVSLFEQKGVIPFHLELPDA